MYFSGDKLNKSGARLKQRQRFSIDEIDVVKYEYHNIRCLDDHILCESKLFCKHAEFTAQPLERIEP